MISVALTLTLAGAGDDDGAAEPDQGQFVYCFNLEEVVPEDHSVRAIAGVLDLSWVYAELAPYYSRFGRPSIDPVLMIRMLIVGYVFGIRSERALCRDVRVNLAYRWFCGLNLEDNTRRYHAPATNVSATAASLGACSSASSQPVWRPASSVAKVLLWTRA